MSANIASEQAVSTSIVYLVRSLGTVWGVAITSAIVQNVLTTRLPLVLDGLPDMDKVRLTRFESVR